MTDYSEAIWKDTLAHLSKGTRYLNIYKRVLKPEPRASEEDVYPLCQPHLDYGVM